MWTDSHARHDPSSTKLQPPGTRVRHLRCLQGGFPDLHMGPWSPLGGGTAGKPGTESRSDAPSTVFSSMMIPKSPGELGSFALSISFPFIPPGRQIFPAVATARCVIPEHGPSPFGVKAGVSSPISFQQTCLPPLTLLRQQHNDTLLRLFT